MKRKKINIEQTSRRLEFSKKNKSKLPSLYDVKICCTQTYTGANPFGGGRPAKCTLETSLLDTKKEVRCVMKNMKNNFKK